MNYKDHLYALILAGGGGTRLWPKSLEKTPKQFLRLFGDKTLFQTTAYRLNKLVDWEKIFCVTVSEEYKKEILKQVKEFLPENIIVEPARRETAPAHGVGALYIYKKDPEAVIVTEAADRLVKPARLYLKTLKAAASYAFDTKKLVTVGIKPTYPHTGYGYIRKGEKMALIDGVRFFKVKKFVEKPILEVAERYVKSGDYFWNAGQFVWRADSILSAIEKNEPQIASNLKKIGKFLGTSDEKKVLKHVYEKMPKISIDYAVAERDRNFVVIQADFFWTDIGDWKEVWENSKKDDFGNVVIDGDEEGGEVINIDTSDALIHTDGRLIAVVDVDDVVIVDTPKALLVCSKSRSQNVKKIVEELKERGKKELL
ncbi:MAG: mannose-1-phosphate guanylyltransferase [Patescibacteria group bacterium]|nr:MAG: mannose-1-phosphate guanylyltransferase [Patescibacteria group bacterium]